MPMATQKRGPGIVAVRCCERLTATTWTTANATAHALFNRVDNGLAE
jgi:hypothetical protein